VDTFDPRSPAFWLPVCVSILCGAVVGIERQLRGKPAGVRTSVLICFGTQLFVRLGGSVTNGSGDPSRILGQVVTGVGFLGAGVMFARGGNVSGVTTAAVIWVLAAIGAAIGLGHHRGAVVLALVTVATLAGVEMLETSLKWLRRGAHEREPDESSVPDE
jgi:putative Mg2+ transporter-C (MgtC) family protein